ncbi:MAG: hypothetical protein PVF73_07820 [Bacteroidales bacterium]
MKNKKSVKIATGLVMLIYFFSGVCSLIDEVVWVRLLKLTLGNTVYASSIVVSVFMGGLALGALIMSKHSDRIKKRLRLYALLELCATVSALLFPLLLRLILLRVRFGGREGCGLIPRPYGSETKDSI